MTLVLGEWLVTSADRAPRRSWGVRVEEGRVAEVGANSDLISRFPDEDRVEGGIVMPGLVDSHMHLYGVLAHGIPIRTAPTGFWSFLDDFWWPAVENALDHEMIVAATEWVVAEALVWVL
jgi:cytosine/adenosine deaminase-related metal-dependent hydrolase